jgi:predicted HTH domain antitoxin
VVDLPAAIAGGDERAIASRLRLLFILDEVRSGRLTRVSAAHALGMPLDDFLGAASRRGIYAIDYDVEDFERELRSIEGLELRGR